MSTRVTQPVDPEQPRCKFDPCFSPQWRDDYCRYHRGQLETGVKLAVEPNASLMWLIDVANGWPFERDSHGCMIWPYRKTRGYGDMNRWVAGKPRTYSPNRWLCEMIHGDPPDDGQEWQAAHECGRGHLGCVTPDHLTWKNPIDNNADKVRHGTRRRGEQVPTAKRTEADIRAILLDNRTPREIAAEHDCSVREVWRLKRGERWRHVYDDVMAQQALGR